MFNNILYYLVVLLVFSVSYPVDVPKEPLSYNLLMIGVTWLAFAGYCRWAFQRLLEGYLGEGEGKSGLAGEYQGMALRLSLLAIFLFALDVHLFNLKYWLRFIPLVGHFTVLQGLLALGLFLFYQCTIWHFGFRAYSFAFKAGIQRASFILSNVRLNVPILFPWFILTLIFDLLSLTPLSGPNSFLNRAEGQVLFFGIFLVALMIFMPPLVQYWWGCKPLTPSEKTRVLETFLTEKGFTYRALLSWPIFEGRMLTAGIMGIVPRYRYILLTDSLMQVLTTEELKAVTAHEMGHARYRHMLYYTLFILAYMVLSFGLMDLFAPLIAFLPLFAEGFARNDSNIISLYFLVSSLPLLVSLLIYFRYVMGFFMRQFERQADLFSAAVMGGPVDIIRSLEKIALLSGKIRDLPSWHHFSIRQRVEVLWKMFKEPGLVKRHNRFVALCLAVYFLGVVGFGYALNAGATKDYFALRFAEKSLKEQIRKNPENPLLYQTMARLYHETEHLQEAKEMYERALALAPDEAVVLNNLAWLLTTAPDKGLRDEKRALILAREAVARERSAVYLDTLAEAYYANGLIEEAVTTIQEAISVSTENTGYYKGQLEKFLSATSHE